MFPRATVDLSGAVLGNDLPGVATLRDKELVDVGGLLSPDSMSLTITGRGVVPLLGTVTEKIRRYQVKLVGQLIHYEGAPIAPVVETLVARVLPSLRGRSANKMPGPFPI